MRERDGVAGIARHMELSMFTIGRLSCVIVKQGRLVMYNSRDRQDDNTFDAYLALCVALTCTDESLVP